MADHGKSSSARKHHEKSRLCYTRPSYREARWERAVKVYTVNMESRYIVVSGIASIGVQEELIDKFSSFGNILEYRKLDDYPTEEFTEAYLIKYEKINNARFTKRKMDNKSFFGGILHVFYAPEYETVEECRYKLEERCRTIARKTQGYFKEHQSRQDQLTSAASVSSEITKPAEMLSEATKPSPSTTTTDTSTPTTSHTSNTPLTNTGYEQNNYLWNLPPLPPPPCETHPAARGISTGHYVPRALHTTASRGSARGQFSTSNFDHSTQRSPAFPRPSNFHNTVRGNFTNCNLHPTSRGTVAGQFSPRYVQHLSRGNLGMNTGQVSLDSLNFIPPPRGNPAHRGTITGRFPLQSGEQRFSQNNTVHGPQSARFSAGLDAQFQNATPKRHFEAETSSTNQTLGENAANKKQRKRI